MPTFLKVADALALTREQWLGGNLRRGGDVIPRRAYRAVAVAPLRTTPPAAVAHDRDDRADEDRQTGWTDDEDQSPVWHV